MWLLFPSARAAMTFPSAESDLLMFLASSRIVPSAPVLLTFSEPACARGWEEFKIRNVTTFL